MGSHSEHVVLQKFFCGSGWRLMVKTDTLKRFQHASEQVGRAGSQPLGFLLGLIVSTLDGARAPQEERSRYLWRTRREPERARARDCRPRPAPQEPRPHPVAPPTCLSRPGEGCGLHSLSLRKS